jgi:nitrite reductase (NO-forming)
MSNVFAAPRLQANRRNFLKASAVGLGGFGSGAVNSFIVPAAAAAPADLSKLQRVKQQLVPPPFAPVHEQTAGPEPRIIEVSMDIIEQKMVIDDEGTEVWALTFGGSVPGPLIVAHEGDYVELTLRNLPSNIMEHNIDFHSSTGALGGGALTHVLPGEQAVLRWKATKPGVFVYHCAPGDVMIPYHVVHGMNGAVMVLPREGLKDAQGKSYSYDKVFYIGEQDYYIPRDKDGAYKKYEMAGENMADALDVMRTLTPTHVVFNGAKGSMTGDKALKATVGEKVLFIHAQANRDTRPHLIGGHGDLVWEGGSFTDVPKTGMETWFVRGGSASTMAYEFRQPGVYAYVNHNLIEAVMLGATAHVVVDGEWDDDLMMQVAKPTPFTM